MEISVDSKVRLSNGVEMPLFGLGMYLMEPGVTSAESVRTALGLNYRHFDTAEYYHNESDLGDVLAESTVPREEVFITSKVFQTKDGADACTQTFQKCLKNLQCAYVDQYLLHAPQGGKVIACYDALLELQKQGLVRTVGVSNFGVAHLEAMKSAGRPLPAVNQIELHPWCLNTDIVEYCKANDIAIVGYSPLTKGRKLNDPILSEIASKYNKSPAQVLIRWSLQNGFITIPKSSNTQHLAENADVFDFSLSDEHMSTLSSFGKSETTVTGWNPTLNPMSEFGPTD